MMRLQNQLLATAIILAAAASPARADTFVLTSNRIVGAVQALAQLSTYDKVVKDAQGHDQIVKQFYDIPPDLRLAIAKDSYVLSECLRAIQDAVRSIQQAAGAEQGTPADKVKAQAKVQADITTLSERPQEVTLEPIDLKALTRVGPEPVPATVLTALVPISSDALASHAPKQ